MRFQYIGLALLICLTSEASRRGELRLSGFVPIRAEIDFEGVSSDGNGIDILFRKNTRSMNFKFLLQSYRNRQKKLVKEFVLSQIGERRRIDLRKYRKRKKRMQFTIQSP